MPAYTPMMEQYFSIKKEYPHCILMFRMGDFFEMFFDDAVTVAKELDLVLTGRSCGQDERAPMCGVPHHAVDGYLARLVEKGYHVAICEQVEDPKLAKGIVKREVVRVVTPGTVTDAQMLDEGRNNYIVALHPDGGYIGLASADITTGLFSVTAIPDEEKGKLLDEITRLNPAEILLHESFPLRREAENAAGFKATVAPAWTFKSVNAYKTLTSHFNTLHLEGFGLKHFSPEIPAAGALLAYIAETQKNALSQITAIKKYSFGGYMALDAASRRNLELTADMRGRGKRDSLLGVLDRTKTAMGARLLRAWVELPLTQPAEINRRLDAVWEWVREPLLRAELREYLSSVHDLERIMTRLASQSANARDLSALRASLTALPHIEKLLVDFNGEINGGLSRTFDGLQDIHQTIDEVIVELPPVGVREGGVVKPGYDRELDELLDVKNNGQTWLSELEAREREQTGIKNLKVRYNKVFGYYIEITKSQLALAPAYYIRRQTLANCERFITDELKKLEDTILGADEKQIALEYEIFDRLRRHVVGEMARIQFTAMALATLDTLQALADTAERNGYTRPAVNDGGEIVIKDGRHPVVEQRAEGGFVPNDTRLDRADNRLAVITGPNMAGKSTYMRQVALITLMAQIGSFVPASEAVIGVVDRIFTRVGASDDLATGQSTFMVEMTEVANILHGATGKSLVLLDEIGRGTSTFDGLAIAWAVTEYIADQKIIGAKTLFATHYHELTELEGRVPGVVNYCFTVLERDGDVAFLRKIARGGGGRSFGIHVAKLAGVPAPVLRRAAALLSELNEADIAKRHDGETEKPEEIYPADSRLADAVREIDVEKLTPLEAIVVLDRLKAIISA
jgi:DNA mismatch repair protein MutS